MYIKCYWNMAYGHDFNEKIYGKDKFYYKKIDL